MDELSEHAILWNTAALTSLKRQQLMSLSKRYGLKASGKNVEMVQRLHDLGQTLTPNAKAIFDMAASSVQESPSKSPTKSAPTPALTEDDVDDVADLTPPQAPALTRLKKPRPSTISLARRGSWEVIDGGDASLIEEEDEGSPDDNNGDSVATRSWKSADNGAPLDDFGKGERYGSLRGVGSLRSLASSIRRTASRTLSTKERSSPVPTIAFPGVAGDAEQAEEEPIEEVLCPSPASTINVPKRIRDHDSIHHRPSTIRLVSPTTSMLDLIEVDVPDSPLPLTGQNSVAHIKERRSMKPLRDGNPYPPVSIKNRRSLPTLLSPASNSRLYPAIPAFDPTAPPEVLAAMATPSPEPEMPGSFPASPANNSISPSSPSFVFGTTQAVSNGQFSDAGAKLLAEFQAKMGGSGIFSTELLKGKDADVSNLTTAPGDLPASSSSGSSGSGMQKRGTFGLAPGPEANDRYAAAHRREFQRMKSLQSMNDRKVPSSSTSSMKPSMSSSALESKAAGKRKLDAVPDAVPEAVEAPTERGSKRSKPAPAVKPGLIDAFRRSRAASKSPVKTKSSLKTTVGSRFGFLRGHKKTPSGGSIVTGPGGSIVTGPVASPSKSPDSTASDGSYLLPSVKVPEDKLVPVPSRLQRLSSKSTTLRTVKGSAPPSSRPPSIMAVSSAASSASASLGWKSAPRRGAFPDFGPHKPTFQPLKDNSQDHGSQSSRMSGASAPPSTSHRYKPSASTTSMNSITRSGANQDLARMASGELRANALRSTSSSSTQKGFPSARQPSSSNLCVNTNMRREPSTSNLRSPSITNLRSPSMSSIPRSRSSTLLAPTASSLARMQATVKPSPVPSSSGSGSTAPAPAHRPLPHVPKGASLPPIASTLTPGMSGLGLAQPFGEASSRANFLFESNFHISPSSSKLFSDGATPSKLPQPAKKKPTAMSPLKSPAKRGLPQTPKSPVRRSAANRARASGLTAIKAGPHTNNADVARRRTEVRGKQERLTQEKELRMMLG